MKTVKKQEDKLQNGFRNFPAYRQPRFYNNPTIRERISSLRAVKKVQAHELVPDTSVQDRERELRRQIQKLREEKKMLIEQTGRAGRLEVR